MEIAEIVRLVVRSLASIVVASISVLALLIVWKALHVVGVALGRRKEDP